MLLLLAALALADAPAAPTAAPTAEATAPPAEATPPPEAAATDLAAALPPAPPAPSFADRVDEAIRVRQSGDVEAARSLLVALEPLVPAEELLWYLYQRGICEELAFRPEAALAFYDRVLELGGPGALDARFRRVIVLEELGLFDAALLEVRAIDRARGLSPDDELTIALQRGVTELTSGKRRVGIRRIQKALDATEGGDSHRYLRAKARYHLAQALLDEADARELTGSEKRVVKRLEQRALGIKAAERQIIALAALQEPEWVLASLVAFGDSHVRLADDLAAVPPPKKLTPEQAAIYREELGKKVENVRTKAFHAYDQGVALATRLAWESPNVTTLKERRATLEARR